jgi:hypothetical protein
MVHLGLCSVRALGVFYPGSMLWSTLVEISLVALVMLTISGDFLQKNWQFLEKQCYDHFSCANGCIFKQNKHFRLFSAKKILKS